MRITFVTLGFPPLIMSGLDVSGGRLVRGLLDAGHHVTVVAGQRGAVRETEYHPNLQMLRLPLNPTNWIGFSLQAAQVLKELPQQDVSHFWDVHFAWASTGRYVASVQHSFRQRLNTWAWGDTHLLGLAYRHIYYQCARWLAEVPSLRRANGVLAGSAAARAEYIEHYRLVPDKIRLARHGIDTTRFKPDPHNADRLRRQLGLAPQTPVILFAGFVTPRKGMTYLAQAYPLVKPRPYLVLTGRWSPRFRSAFLQQLGPLASRVIEAGFVPDDLMPAYYTMADVYVSSSLLEGFGLPLAEALACGTPVVAFHTGATPEVVGPGGVLVPPRDTVLLAEAISDLLQKPDKKHALGEVGRARIMKEFSLGKMLADTLTAYQAFA
jgi:glycosyltransferase involved in cell wall biosynthesis